MGRPKKNTEKRIVIPVDFSAEEKEKLRQEAIREGRSLAGWVRHLISTHPARKNAVLTWAFIAVVLTGCAEEGKKPWVWYAPYFQASSQYGPGSGVTPDSMQMGYYFNRLREEGIHPIGVDVGESYGSPRGNEIFDEFYARIQSEGFQEKGCMILQSRGALMGYTWALKNQDKISCVLGIYPLTTVEDYVGVNVIAPVWGMSPADLLANLATLNPLNRASEITFPVLHIHGNVDSVVHIEPSRQFADDANGEFIEVANEGHAYASDSFFRSQAAIDFLLRHVSR